MPLPAGFVVKNGSKIRERICVSIPIPLSANVRQTNVPWRSSGSIGCAGRSITWSEVVIVSRPPLGMASRALTARFIAICSSMLVSA